MKFFFQNFCLIFDGIFFSKLKIFENFYIQPPNFISFTCSKHPKWKLHEGLIVLTSSQTKRQAFKVSVGWFRPPPAFLGLKWPLNLENFKSGLKTIKHPAGKIVIKDFRPKILVFTSKSCQKRDFFHWQWLQKWSKMSLFHHKSSILSTSCPSNI